MSKETVNQMLSEPDEVGPSQTGFEVEFSQRGPIEKTNAAAAAAARVAYFRLISDLVAAIQAEAEAVSQAVTRLVDVASTGGSDGGLETSGVGIDCARVQEWLEATARLAALVCEVNHPMMKGLGAEVDALTDSVRRRLPA